MGDRSFASPLLRGGDDSGSPQPSQARSRRQPARQRPRPASIAPLLVLLLLVNLAMSLYQLPLNRVLERQLCRAYYSRHVVGRPPAVFGPDDEVKEELCKIGAIQMPLARLQLVMDVAWVGGDMLLTIPLAAVAARYGRRFVLWLNLLPRLGMLAWVVVVGSGEDWLPTNAIVLGPFLSLLGGGDCVLSSIAYAYATGITHDNIRRATYFGYISSVTYIVNLVGPALAAATMSRLIWLPFYIGLGLLCLAVVVADRIPNGVGDHNRKGAPPETEREQAESLLGPMSLKHHHPMSDGTSPTGGGAICIVARATKDRLYMLLAVALSRPRNFGLLLFSMFLTSLASADTKLLVQYISKRYGWTFAAAGYLISGKAIVNFLLLGVVVPAVLRSRHARRLQQVSLLSTAASLLAPSAERSNVQDATTSLVVSVLGALAISISWSVWVLVPALLLYALGSALPIFTFSLLKSPQVSPTRQTPPSASSSSSLHSHHAEPQSRISGDGSDSQDDELAILSIVMIVKTIGSLVGYPAVSGLWILGMRLEGIYTGLPYMLSAVCYVLAMGFVRAMRLA